MKRNEINNELITILKNAAWEYNFSTDQLIDIYFNDIKDYSISKGMLQVKLLNGYSWHKLIKVLGSDAFELLNDDIIKKVFPVSYRNELFNAKRILMHSKLNEDNRN